MWFISKYITRVMDENKIREDNYREMLREFTPEMKIISETLAKLHTRIEDARKEHEDIINYHQKGEMT